MDANVYQEHALRTWRAADGSLLDGGRLDYLYHAGQISSEAGEVAGLVAKWAKFGKPLDGAELALELGDLLWHVGVMAAMLGYELGDIMAMNLDKLQVRHPDGDPAGWYAPGSEA